MDQAAPVDARFAPRRRRRSSVAADARCAQAWRVAIEPSTRAPDLPLRVSALLRADRCDEAAAALRHALDTAPAAPVVMNELARTAALMRAWLNAGRTAQALAVLAPVAESDGASGEWLMLCGHALMALGRKGAAEGVLRRWLAREPGNPDATLRLAAVLADNDKPVEAEKVVRACVGRQGESTSSAFVLGRALLGQARFDEAEAEFRKVVRAQPGHLTAQANLMELVWMRTGDVGEASRSLDDALRAQPDRAGLRLTKSRLLMSARRPRAALVEIEAGLARAPRNPELLAAAANIALEFDGARALAHAQCLAAIAPQARIARMALGNASLATGDARRALAIADALHRDDPVDGRALALCADALRILGDPRARGLLDYTHLVRAECIDTPDSWPDLAAYLADLAADLDRSHTLRAHPIGNSLRGGSQIPLMPQESPFASVRAFSRAIDGVIRRYMQAIGTGNDPVRRRNTGRYRLSGMWSVRLRPGGLHVSHYHPAGWISSACYLRLPPAVARRGGEGWLKFGEPAFPTRPMLQPEYFIKPEPGLLVLFPAYMWHGTVPFAGGQDDARLTIAFDVVPAGLQGS